MAKTARKVPAKKPSSATAAIKPEPPRVCRKLFRLSHAAMAGSSGVA
jgi:hypothetical protein